MIALGDALEKVLRCFGVTKERVSALLGESCGCSERQQALNAIGLMAQLAAVRFLGRAYSRACLLRHSALAHRFVLFCRHARFAIRALWYGY